MPLPLSPLQVGTLKKAESYILTRVNVSTYLGRKQVTMGDNSRAVVVEDIGQISEQKVGQPDTSSTDGPEHSQLITGEVEVVEYFESFIGCIKCKGKVHPTDGSANCQKCNIAFKERCGTRKMAASLQIGELHALPPPELRLSSHDNSQDDEGQSTLVVAAAAAREKLITATMFEREVDILLSGPRRESWSLRR